MFSLYRFADKVIANSKKSDDLRALTSVINVHLSWNYIQNTPIQKKSKIFLFIIW